jgi:prepilin-type N-terminal cleavage/methylation domain-containing protein
MTAATRNQSRGFTLVELLAVIAIVGILALITFPALARFVPNQRVSGEAKQVDAIMQRARLRAATSQKPVRVVVNCSGIPCWAEIQLARYTFGAVSGWEQEPGTRHPFSDDVTAVRRATGGAYSYDGATAAPNGVFYAIFMPDSRVFSDPRPFDVFFYHRATTTLMKQGWRLSLGPDSGRVSTAKISMEVTP